MRNPFAIISIVLIFFSCQTPSEKSPISDGEKLYRSAAELVAQTQLDSALLQLTLAFEKDLENPMRIVQDSKMYPLIQHQEYRPKIRDLIRQYCDNSHAIMVRPEEQGQSIKVKGQILDEVSQKPISGALVELVHTDNDGDYFKEKTLWNPRIFAYLKTNAKGEFSVETILPGIYLDDEDQPVPAHIHFTLEKEGYRVYASEFTFDDDPVFKANGNVENVPVAKKEVMDGEEVFEVKLFMQPVN
ncbi:MAG: hypothetical protein DWQ02_06500 [Bacteroidetes bacterium]|nr:MAG: hypothetical protein DWQ02_06500 [Bacteroidota bacterium]